MSVADGLAFVGVVIAGVAFLVSVNTLRIASSSLRTANVAATNDVAAELRGWADEVVDVLSEADDLCWSIGAKNRLERNSSCRARLAWRASALVDRGRFFFPNLGRIGGSDGSSETDGKPAAFRGLRPPILDLVLLAHFLLRSIDLDAASRDQRRRFAFVQIRREFVSAIQRAITIKRTVSPDAYERQLAGVTVEAIPNEIRALARAERVGFMLAFTDAPIHQSRAAGDRTAP